MRKLLVIFTVLFLFSGCCSKKVTTENLLKEVQGNWYSQRKDMYLEFKENHLFVDEYAPNEKDQQRRLKGELLITEYNLKDSTLITPSKSYKFIFDKESQTFMFDNVFFKRKR